MPETTKRPATGSIRPRLTATRPTTNGYVRIPEPEITQRACPKCGAENVGRKIYLWRVSDERGVHNECDVCATQFNVTTIPKDGTP